MKSSFLYLFLIVSSWAVQGASGQVSVYVSPNDIETAAASGIAGVTNYTETFNALATGTTSISGYHSTAIGATYTTSTNTKIIANDQYGGYQQGNYLGVPSGSSATITLDPGTSAQYFGFYFTAGDRYNQIQIYSGNTQLLSFTTASLIDMLPNTAGSKVTAINGNTYNTVDYYGKPVTNENGTEPYAYLHFITSGGVTFDKIVLTQTSRTTAIFENDNHTILAVAPTLPNTLVVVPVPEPGSLTLLGLASCFLFRRRR